jgi:hypothetical protein
MNLELDDIKGTLSNEKERVIPYIIKTIKFHNNGGFIQTGTGPNFEGNVITLTTCKHQMRSRFSVDEWRGKWIAGFTGVSRNQFSANYLVYLMRVERAFESHKDLWEKLDRENRKTKNARFNTLGDLYQPKNKCSNKYDPINYYKPISGHSHYEDNQWYKDINYLHSRWKRRAILLLGDRMMSYLWNRKLIRKICNFGKRSRSPPDYVSINHFLDDLTAV